MFMLLFSESEGRVGGYQRNLLMRRRQVVGILGNVAPGLKRVPVCGDGWRREGTLLKYELAVY